MPGWVPWLASAVLNMVLIKALGKFFPCTISGMEICSNFFDKFIVPGRGFFFNYLILISFFNIVLSGMNIAQLCRKEN